MKNRKSKSLRGIPLLSIWMILLYSVGLVMQWTNHFYELEYLYLRPQDILYGQVYRLITWILVPSSMHGESITIYVARILLLGFAGLVLEKVWGRRKYNIFILRGLLLTLATAFVVYWSAFVWANAEVAGDLSSMYISPEYSTIFVLLSGLLTLGIVLVRKNLRNYKPNFYAGIFCIVTYAGMMAYELYMAFSFSAASAWVMVSGIIPSLVNVGITVFTYRIRKKKKAVVEEIEYIEDVNGLQVFSKRSIS